MRGCGLALFLTACAHTAPGPKAAEALAALELPEARGGTFRAALAEGRPVLAYFAATWCFPCTADLPVLVRLHERHQKAGLVVLWVGMDLEGMRVLEPFARHYELPFPVVVANDELRQAKTPFGRIDALPVVYLFDRHGSPRLAYAGVASPRELLDLVAKVVEEH